ncbi:MAG: ABC transporter ATP-binding protein [Verrucomicrobia bacterium]|nr:MAG: ABC transporter ATP-binding protein [Verrucomicrobiota bacterium]
MRRDADSAVVVEAENLERRFGEFVAVAGISFAVRAGEVFGFLGPNGAGKSTTIRMLCGLLAPTAGRGRVAGFDMVTETERIKSRIGYMSQRFSLYDELTVEENIDFFSGIYRVARNRKKARKDWVLEMAGLQGHRRTRTAHLPGGWKQRLALGCAVLHEPPIVFLDEPTSGVDPASRRAFWTLIQEMAAAGTTVFVTTHYLEESEYCDRLAIIDRGRIVAAGTPTELKRDHMRGTVLEINCRRPFEAMRMLERLPGVREVALFGAGLHAVVDGDGEVAAMIRSRLEAAGFAPVEVASAVPSLEDVFVSLVEERSRRESGVKEGKGR